MCIYKNSITFILHMHLQILMYLHTSAVRKHVETLEDFKKCIDEIPGANGRELRCEVIDDVLDWQEFLVAANTHLSGHTIAHAMESVNHAFRFIKRSDLKLYKGSES